MSNIPRGSSQRLSSDPDEGREPFDVFFGLEFISFWEGEEEDWCLMIVNFCFDYWWCFHSKRMWLVMLSSAHSMWTLLLISSCNFSVLDLKSSSSLAFSSHLISLLLTAAYLVHLVLYLRTVIWRRRFSYQHYIQIWRECYLPPILSSFAIPHYPPLFFTFFSFPLWVSETATTIGVDNSPCVRPGVK